MSLECHNYYSCNNYIFQTYLKRIFHVSHVMQFDVVSVRCPAHIESPPLLPHMMKHIGCYRRNSFSDSLQMRIKIFPHNPEIVCCPSLQC